MRKNIVVTRILNAPIEKAWKTWVDPQLVMQWWGPDRFTSPSAKMDFHEGATSIVCMRAPKEFGGQDTYSAWEYLKIVPNERIELLQNLCDKDGNKINPVDLGMPSDFPLNVITVATFKDLGNAKTEMTVTEYDWESTGQMFIFAKMGLEQCMDKIVAIFT